MSYSHPLTKSAIGLATLVLALLPSACGKPATSEDCQRIITRITELELAAAEIDQPQQVQQQVNSTRELFSEAAERECVGRRISSSALKCVEKATTAKQIVEECFN